MNKVLSVVLAVMLMVAFAQVAAARSRGYSKQGDEGSAEGGRR